MASKNPEQLLQRLEWTVLRRLDGLLQGDYRSLFRGLGVDLADLREYQPGDDVRYIDWSVTARMDAYDKILKARDDKPSEERRKKTDARRRISALPARSSRSFPEQS